MSYILEALKKSDKERQQGAAPSLQTQHTHYPGLPGARKKRTHIPGRIILPGLIAICIMVSLWLFRDQLPFTFQKKSPMQDVITPAAPPVFSLPEQETEQSAIATEPTVPKDKRENSEQVVIPPVSPVIEQEATVSPNKIILQPAPIILEEENVPKFPEPSPLLEAAEAKITIPFLQELPSATQANLPKMKFAGHTYSDIPGKRMIIVNNNIRREGDSVETGLKLEEITWDGIIMNYRGTRFRVITTM